jgi:hypothetical protein
MTSASGRLTWVLGAVCPNVKPMVKNDMSMKMLSHDVVFFFFLIFNLLMMFATTLQEWCQVLANEWFSSTNRLYHCF